MIYSLEVAASNIEKLGSLNCESHFLCNGTIQTVIIILYGCIHRLLCNARPSSNGTDAGRSEETSLVDDGLCHLRASVI